MTQIKLGDMDGDGILDIVGIYGYGQGFQVWRGNGDGRLDVALGNYTSNVIGVSKNEGDGYFSPTVDSPSSSAAILLAVGHLDGDRFLDAVSTGLTTQAIEVSYGLGKRMFSAPTKYRTGHAVAAAVVCCDRPARRRMLTNHRHLSGTAHGANRRDSYVCNQKLDLDRRRCGRVADPCPDNRQPRQR